MSLFGIQRNESDYCQTLRFWIRTDKATGRNTFIFNSWKILFPEQLIVCCICCAWRGQSQHMAALINVKPSCCLGPSRQFRSDRPCGPCWDSSVLHSLSWINEHCSPFSWVWVGLKTFQYFGVIIFLGGHKKQTKKCSRIWYVFQKFSS